MDYHMIDMIIWYFGLPDNIHAEMSAHAIADNNYDVEDTATILFSYKQGLKKEICGMLDVSRFKSPKKELIVVYGSHGFITIERGSIKRYDVDGRLIESLYREVSWPTASINQVDYFSKVISGEKENISSSYYHLQHMSFVKACYDSYKYGKNIDPHQYLRKITESSQHDEVHMATIG